MGNLAKEHWLLNKLDLFFIYKFAPSFKKIYLFESQSSETDEEIFHLVVHFPEGLNGPG